MGWGWLAPIGKIAAVAAAPFTGGASLAALPAIDAAGQLASGVSANRAAGRAQEAQMGNQADQMRLAAARLNLQAPGQRAHNSVQGDILAGAQPMTISGPITHTHGQLPQISGGLSPALLSQNSRQLGQQMSRQALLSQMQGDFQPTPQPQANGLDKVLNGIGYAGLGANAIGQVRGQVPSLIRNGPPQPQNPYVMYQKPEFTGWAD